MNRMKKIYGFRLGDTVPGWKDRFGKGGGKIIRLIYLKFSGKLQIIVSNGDWSTSEFIHQDDFYKRNLHKKWNEN